MSLFLGLDCSTQSLKASLLDADEGLRVIRELGITFDTHLPHYATQSGVSHGDDGEAYSPVALMVEALELLFSRLKEAEWPLSQVKAVSASGQQHATVYWSSDSSLLLGSFPSEGVSLAQHLAPAFSRDIIPNWQDSSTSLECTALEAAVGGAAALARVTGSSAHTRFSGSQIMKFRKKEPEKWASTERISLVSSALTTLLCMDGSVKGIDEADAGGMNLWDMSASPRDWNDVLIKTAAGSDEEAARLRHMLGAVERDEGRVVGTIGEWYVNKWGMSKECLVCPGTGDNPATFLSFALPPSHAILSLGTSDTILLSSAAYSPDENHHVFVHPALDGQPAGEDSSAAAQEAPYMIMLCFKNGSLAREAARADLPESSWSAFDEAVAHAREQEAGLPNTARFSWLLPEIIVSLDPGPGATPFLTQHRTQPKNAHGTVTYRRADGSAEFAVHSQELEPSTAALCLLEAQLMSYRSRIRQVLDGKPLQGVYAVGGAAQNQTICQLAADVLGADVLRPAEGTPHTNACSVGAALKAYWAFARHQLPDAHTLGFEACIKASRSGAKMNAMVRTSPEASRTRIYEQAEQWWSPLEQRAITEAKV